MKVSTALDWVRQNQQIQDAIIDSIKSEFPIQTKTKTLSIANVKVKPTFTTNDYPAIKELKLKRKTYQTPIHADVTLTDNVTGEVINTVKDFKS